MAYTIGLDYGTNSVRCVLVDTGDGREIGTAVCDYPSGEAGIILDPADHNLARQRPTDYIHGLEAAVTKALAEARRRVSGFDPGAIIGIGVDTTGSTPLPVDAAGVPLACQDRFRANPNAQAWLWKDHTSYAEAAEITARAAEQHPEYLAKCGGAYSSEWFFAKILHCLRTDPAVFDAAHTWVECADYIPAVLTGTTHPDRLIRNRCAAGHKALFNAAWGGLPAADFLARLDPKLGALRARLYETTATIDRAVGGLTPEWADKLGIPAGIPVAVGAFDAHLGAVASGIKPGTLVNTIGTSACIMYVAARGSAVPDIPGLCGIVDGSILPDGIGLEAGQSAVGDIFNWFVNCLQPGGPAQGGHEALTAQAAQLSPGQSGLLALDWNNGNRTILVDPRLTGLLVGQTLHTRPAEIYRALIEATGFGVVTIIKRLEEYGLQVHEVVNCGGIAEKNPLLMQIYADIIGRAMKVSRSAQTCALGAAMAGAVVAGKAAGGHDDFTAAQQAMTGVKDRAYKPRPAHQETYARLYRLYRQLHDAFGATGYSGSLANVMKDLLTIKEEGR